MRNFKPTFTTAVLATILALGIQQTEFGIFRPNVAIADIIEAATSQDSVTISTDNYEETVQWYRDNLNATVEREWNVLELPNVKLANLIVRGQRIDVIGYTASASETTQIVDLEEYIDNSDYASLITFQVDDVDTVIDELAARGIPPLVEAADYPGVSQRIAFIEDNNGNWIKFSQSILSLEYTHLL